MKNTMWKVNPNENIAAFHGDSPESLDQYLQLAHKSKERDKWFNFVQTPKSSLARGLNTSWHAMGKITRSCSKNKNGAW